MKKIFALLVCLFLGVTFLNAQQHLKKNGTPDMRYKVNKSMYSSPKSVHKSNIYLYRQQHLKKDGTPDMRYKENKSNYTQPKNVYQSTVYPQQHLKKDGSIDKRYKTNSLYSPYSIKRDKNGKIIRSEAAKRAFMKLTGYPKGRPGYVIDHIKPLKEGGCDCPENMQWQTIAAAKAKDKWE